MSLTPGQSHAGTYFLEVVLGWFDRSHHFNLESIMTGSEYQPGDGGPTRRFIETAETILGQLNIKHSANPNVEPSTRNAALAAALTWTRAGKPMKLTGVTR